MYLCDAAHAYLNSEGKYRTVVGLLKYFYWLKQVIFMTNFDLQITYGAAHDFGT